VPNVSCTGCGLTSYAPTPHSAPSLCPYCDAELFPARRTVRKPSDDDATATSELEVEAA
jgi:hypothetical protein